MNQKLAVTDGNGIARQGFGSQELERRDTVAVAMAERTRAEVQARCIVALQRPRNIGDVRLRVLDHCRRPRFAEVARYKKKVGWDWKKREDVFAEGPSIRFVEVALQEYGNVHVECVPTWEDDSRITIQVTVTDLERNNSHSDSETIAKVMERKKPKEGQEVLGRRTNSVGEVVFLVAATADHMLNAKNAAQSKIVRNLGLRILPRDITEEAMEIAIDTARSATAEDPAAARKRLADGFHRLGVSQSAIEQHVGHALDASSPVEIEHLRGIWTAINSGEMTWSEVTADVADAATEDEKHAKKSKAAGLLDKRKARKARTTPAVAPLSSSAAPEKINTPPKKAAPAPAPADSSAAAVRDIRAKLERVLSEPALLSDIWQAWDALPEGPSREQLYDLIGAAESELASNDPPPPSDEDGPFR